MKNLLSKADRDFLTRARNTGWCYMPEEWEGETHRRATRLLAGGWIAPRPGSIRRGNGQYGITAKARKWLDNYIMYEARNPLKNTRNFYYSVAAMTSDPDPKRVFLSQHNYMKTAGYWTQEMTPARMRFATPVEAMTAAQAAAQGDSVCVDPKSLTLLKITVSTTVEEADFKVE